MNLKKTVLAGAAMLAVFSGEIAGAKDANDAATRKLLDPANMDKAVKPGDNFFLYANGAWLKNNPIPSTETRWGSFNELQENNYKALHTLLEKAAANKNAKPGSADQKVGDLYRSGMDTVAIEKAGITPLNGLITRINGIKDANSLLAEIALEHTEGIGDVFSFGIGPDDKNVTHQISQFSQSGLGLPDRDYYFNTDARTTKIREAYKQYLVKMFVLIGDNQTAAEADAKSVYSLEESLAKASMTRVEMRDPYKLYNKFNLDGLNKETPGLDWKSLFTMLKIKGEDSAIVGQPKFFAEVGKQLTATPVDVWKKYLVFHLVNGMAPYMSSNFDQTRFDFYGRTLRGQQAQKPRWKRVLSVVDGSIGELLGQMYVDANFKPEAKKRMLELVNNLQQTYAEHIQHLDWMSAETKKKALVKLNTFMKKIGYPDKWKDYSKLQIVGNDYVKNIIAASAFEYDFNLSKLGRPVDRTEWGMTPPTVNAYYNPAFNEIVFPAGILQYPFFDFAADDAVNYGGIGAVIGHEMTHGFDDQGRQYDADGNLNDWWTAEDAKKFEEKSGVVVKQFNSYTVLDSVHVNGELTLGENLADLGGLAIAYDAFKKTKEGKSNEKIDGFTPDQRFFLSWAQVWRANTRPEEMASRIMTDPHSPNELRCNGPLSNIDVFYKAFDIKPGDKMYRQPSERAKVW
ncbi:M13 family metallopeptidase [Taibaiella soli]|uniref:M13 family peptidase n=1 Tax=Taibaiella soli TaxID=1649169 RepID=A0A2W2B3U2_9BACT|nr:M13 family metallopeptidase [Taibaiella soli]PZF70899.1 M13 family peptidase [Taibaiella soli]